MRDVTEVTLEPFSQKPYRARATGHCVSIDLDESAVMFRAAQWWYV
jgi:hypothetical protein